MVTISYEHEFEYTCDEYGKWVPRLTFRASTPEDQEIALDVEAYLDLGAERSLFNGEVGVALGIDVLTGKPITYQSAIGGHLSATIHPVRLVHDDLGAFDLEVGFTSSEIRRNLLGRDFFNLIQIGIREHHLSFYVTPVP